MCDKVAVHVSAAGNFREKRDALERVAKAFAVGCLGMEASKREAVLQCVGTAIFCSAFRTPKYGGCTKPQKKSPGTALNCTACHMQTHKRPKSWGLADIVKADQ